MMKHKKASKIGTAAAILGSVILSGSTAFAYAPAQTTRTESNTSMTTFESVNFSSNQESSNLWTDSRIIFTDSNDSTTLIDANNLETRAIICTHVYESGYADTHTSKSNGGCVVRTYKAKRCLKCNDIVFGELLNTVTYAKCIHK